MSMSGGYLFYYINAILWILAWILVAIAAGVGASRTGRKIHVVEMIFACLLAMFRMVHQVMIDPNFGLLSPRISPISGAYSTWSSISGIVGLLLFSGFCICFAIDKFTSPRPNVQSFPVGPAVHNPYQRQR
jgi:hypothetical protein